MPRKKKPKGVLTEHFPEFKNLVDMAAQEIHSGLLIGGGKEMRATLYLWMTHAIAWDREQRGK